MIPSTVDLTVGGLRLRLTDDQAQELRRQLGESPRNTAPPVPEILTPDEAAPLMRHSAKSIRALCGLRKSDPRYLRHLRKGRKILIPRAHVDEWLARQIDGSG
jgi:hypothetical protein